MRKLLFLTLAFGLSLPAMSERKRGEAQRSVIYSPVGKRDPFRPPTLKSVGRDVAALDPLEKYSLEQLQLRAVLRDSKRPQAMFQDPEGKTYILSEGDTLGRERATVSKILNTEVILTERTFNYLGVESLYEKVMSLPPDPDVGELEMEAK